jgi:hypothetical protein
MANRRRRRRRNVQYRLRAKTVVKDKDRALVGGWHWWKMESPFRHTRGRLAGLQQHARER